MAVMSAGNRLESLVERRDETTLGIAKDITPVVQTVGDAGIARRVARLWPLMTIKGWSYRRWI